MKRRVLAAVDDIFFASKIRGTAESVGVEYDTARTVESAIEKARASRPSIIIADLHSQRYDPFALAQALKADAELRDVPLVGFFSHVQTDLRERALAAGFDRVFARSAFTNKLSELLRGEGG
jgi:PleD family two-component response regulator